MIDFIKTGLIILGLIGISWFGIAYIRSKLSKKMIPTEQEKIKRSHGFYYIKTKDKSQCYFCEGYDITPLLDDANMWKCTCGALYQLGDWFTRIDTTQEHKISEYHQAFCSKCLRNVDWFKGGGSWSPDMCPCGEDDTIRWDDMTMLQRIRGVQIYKTHMKEHFDKMDDDNKWERIF